MRKNTKTIAVISAAAALTLGAAFSSMAATGWVEEDGIWYYYDSDGNRVEDEWKKSGDNWYWLDSEENGAMAVDKLIEDDDDTYYVNENGVMVKNSWVMVVNEDVDDDDPAEYHYYYMQSNGKAYKQTGNSVSKKTINGKKYAFDEDGKMLYGWVTEDGDLAEDDEDWENAVYYFGTWDDGSMKTGWQKISVYDSTSEKDDDYDYWFNFKSNGKKRTHENDDDTWKSNGKYYHFDSRGVMVYEWFMTTDSNIASASNWAYFSSPEDGARLTKGWFKVIPPTDDNSFAETDNTFASEGSEDEDALWYYAGNKDDGLAVGEIKKISGKYYGFWPDDGENGGKMLTGLCALRMDEEDGSQIEEVIYDDMDSSDLDDFLDIYGDQPQSESNIYLYYFGDDADADVDGAMKTGNVTINLDGDTYQFYFKKSGGIESRGRGLNGVDDDYIYNYGVKIKADSDEKYILVYASDDASMTDAVVVDYDSVDVRNLNVSELNLSKDSFSTDDGNITVVSGFEGKDNGWYLVNTSGKIQTSTKSGLKDGDDWYWFLYKGNVIMYANDKDRSGSVLSGSDWQTYFSTSED